MSPVRSQPSSVERLCGLLGHVAVAGHHDVAADQHLAVVGELDLDARRRRADGAELDPVGRVARCRARRSPTSPELATRGCRCAWKNSSTSTRRRRGADVDGERLVEPEHRAQHGENISSRRPAATRSARSAGTVLAGLLEPHLLERRRQAPARADSRCSSGSPASIASSPAFSFSQIRGTAKNQCGRTADR